MHNPKLVTTNSKYFPKLLSWYNIPYQLVGGIFKVSGFDSYNHLVEVNRVFSTNPQGEPIDRTGAVQMPLNYKIIRPWQPPTQTVSLEQFFEDRVCELLNTGQVLYLSWSGGIDSTAMVSAFLTHCKNLDQLKLVYSPFSIYENPEFFEWVSKQFPSLEKLDLSGEHYLNFVFDGILVTGHGGDEHTASLDESFYEKNGTAGLHKPWQDLFSTHCKNNFFNNTKRTAFIDFCEQWFIQSHLHIKTVLQARWWFYSAAKSQYFGVKELALLFGQQDLSVDQYCSFYDCQGFENYMVNNVDQLIEPNKNFKHYKKFLKQYINNFWDNQHYFDNMQKVNSTQFVLYRLKKTALLDLEWVCLLEDASAVRTPNLPLFSHKEFKSCYGNSLDYLFEPARSISRTVA